MKDTLSRLRKTKKITQQEVADALGIARNTYTQYELGRRVPDYETMKKLAAYYNVSIDYLLDGTTTQTVQLADLLTKADMRIFVGEYELPPQHRGQLLTIIRAFSEAVIQREKAD
ncbi:MAG: xre [Paenibacillus sp.]|jgi:transcriptional regulator with XRE-family HTH domain|nr:xre [Paenibacillus sp.]